MKYGSETPFATIESAQQFVELLIQAISDSKRDVDGDIALSGHNGPKKKKHALRLVSANLAKLNQHMTNSRRILNHLKTLRRLLLEEWQLPDTQQIRNGDRQVSRWS